MRTLIEPHDSLAIVAPRQAGGDEDISFATDATGCITTALREAYPAVKIVRADEFHRSAFPDFPVEEKPNATQDFSLIVEDAKFRERIARLSLRYLILVEGRTNQHAKPIIGAIAGGGGGAVTWFGAQWDRRSSISATIFDLKQAMKAGTVQASAAGEPWVVCIGLGPLCAPIGAPAFTEAKACKELGEGVVKFLAGENHPDMVFVYGKDERVVYSYNSKADPPERYKQAVNPMTHPLNNIDETKCPQLRVCVERYITEARNRAQEVSYALTNEDEELFRKDSEIAANLDVGKITKEDAVQLYNTARGQKEPGRSAHTTTADLPNSEDRAITVNEIIEDEE